MTIGDITKEYAKAVEIYDLQLLLSHTLQKSREFVLAHPEYILGKSQISSLRSGLNRRIKGEPIAYILGHKEFYGLDFVVNKHTLVPRPETELMVDFTIKELRSKLRNTTIVDVGTGSGNIIISIAKAIESFKFPVSSFKFIGIDISKEALAVAKKNARVHDVDKKINFLHDNFLSPLLKPASFKLKTENFIVIANLPYLSKEIYESAPHDVKDFEPKSALYSPSAGLSHYKKLLQQLEQFLVVSCKLSVVCYFEISPEQKTALLPVVKNILPDAKIKFHKDLAGKWRVCTIRITQMPSC